ncbi:MAG: sugar phosphate isomerase/epimerase [Dehalococcoidia bacterium]|nr:MAG: sugar phosphate isomerase/epimerase [Dehalococcoidia bacterium]
MNDNLHSYMKVGIVQLMAYPEMDTVESIRKIAEDEFFGAIEIATAPEEIKDEVMQILGASHLVIGYVGQPLLLNNKLDLNSLVPQQREAAISMIKGGVDEAYMLGARQLAVLSGPAPAKSKYDQAKELLVDSLSQICSYAQSKGNLGITMEIFDREYDKKCLIGPTPEAVEVAKKVKRNYPNFGLMIDLSHLPLLKEKPDYAVKTAKNYLAHVHIGNCILKNKSHPAYGDKHPPFGLAAGENDVEEVRLFLKALMEIGYIGAGKQNVVAFEVKPLAGQNPDVVVANAKRTLMEAWARL